MDLLLLCGNSGIHCWILQFNFFYFSLNLTSIVLARYKRKCFSFGCASPLHCQKYLVICMCRCIFFAINPTCNLDHAFRLYRATLCWTINTMTSNVICTYQPPCAVRRVWTRTLVPLLFFPGDPSGTEYQRKPSWIGRTMYPDWALLPCDMNKWYPIWK